MSQAAIEHLTRADDILGKLILQVGVCAWKPERRHSPFESLMRAIVFQQLNGIAAKTILGRVKALYGDTFPTPDELLATSEAELRAAGLSRNKLAALKDLAAKTLDGTVPAARAIVRLSDEEIVTRLTEIRGVGRWTAEMLLIFKLGRKDVLPATDFGVRSGFALTYRKRRMPTPLELLKHGERWRPYRTYAAWYLWRSLELPRAGTAKNADGW